MVRIVLALLGILGVAQSLKAEWLPSGATPPGLGERCHPQLWSQKFLSKVDHDQKSRFLSEWISDCQSRWQSGRPQGLDAEKQIQELPNLAPQFTSFSFVDRNGVEQRGAWLKQESNLPRPLALVACDFDCDPRVNPWLKRVIHHLYEEGPFHLALALSPESDARGWLAGGLAYGQSLYEIGFWLQTELPWRQKISSVQLFGEGWGAQGSLMALLYNEKNPMASDRNVFQGHLALCPVVSLNAALSTLQDPQNESQLRQSERFRMQLLERKQNIPQWSVWFKDWTWGEPFAQLWLEATLEQSQNRSWLNPFLLNRPRTPSDWLEANENSLQLQSVKTPSWQLGSQNDPRFAWDEHGARLAAQNRDPRKSRLRSHAISDKSSCAFASSLGWDVEGALWRALLLAESHEIWPRQTWTNLEWAAPAPRLQPHERHLEQNWSVNTKGQVRIHYWIMGQNGVRRKFMQMVDTQNWPDELRPRIEGPLSAWRWTRALNTRLRLLDHEGRALIENANEPRRLSWWRWTSY